MNEPRQKLHRIIEKAILVAQQPRLAGDALRGAGYRAASDKALSSPWLIVQPLGELVDEQTIFQVRGISSRFANVTLYERLAVAALVAQRRPQRMLEIGTFDGATTLHMALNAPAGAQVYTLDLPPDIQQPALATDIRDTEAIADQERFQRKYRQLETPAQVTQLLGDSAQYDFRPLGQVDFAFIDGSHSYEYVKNDTEKVLDILSPDGCILWHDYRLEFPGIIRYLNELGRQHRLVHIADTSMVYLPAWRAPVDPG